MKNGDQNDNGKNRSEEEQHGELAPLPLSKIGKDGTDSRKVRIVALSQPR